MSIDPDTKDWTWVLTRSCDECGFDAQALTRNRLPGAIRDNATLWQVVLGTEDAAVRPSPHVWSPLEYACLTQRVTVASYDAFAEAYLDSTAATSDQLRAAISRFVAALPAAGLSGRRTDITAAFVAMLRADGHDADVVDPLVDDLADPDPDRDEAYDGVWAAASLLHVRREDFALAVRRLAGAGWTVCQVDRATGLRDDHWLNALARRT